MSTGVLPVREDLGRGGPHQGTGKQRRCSLVIHETQQLLNGLQTDANRSTALMAELETLLAAAHVAAHSGTASAAVSEEQPGVLSSANFKAAKPLEIPADEDDDLPNVPDRADISPSRRLKTLMSVRRTSSVVTLDAAALLGPAVPASVATTATIPLSSNSSFSSTITSASTDYHAAQPHAASFTCGANFRAKSMPSPYMDGRRSDPFRRCRTTADGSTAAAEAVAPDLAIIGSRPPCADGSLCIDSQHRNRLPPSRRSSVFSVGSSSGNTPTPTSAQVSIDAAATASAVSAPGPSRPKTVPGGEVTATGAATGASAGVVEHSVRAASTVALGGDARAQHTGKTFLTFNRTGSGGSHGKPSAARG